MIISEEIEVILNNANLKHYYSLGYQELKSGNKLVVPIEHLTNGSHAIVKVKCDICGKEKDLMYRFYIKSLKSNGFYVCPKCSGVKISKSLSNKNIDDRSIINEKIKNTCLEKYGSNNPSRIEKFKEKRKNTMLERHGVEYYVLNKDFLEKSQQTSMINYGTLHPMMSEKMKTVREAYYIKMGYNILTDEFDIYKSKVYSLTKKVKKDLLNNWNGKDYYDGEYIRDNFNLPYHDINYPTIDHKITIFEGFKNNIDAEIIADISNLCFTKRCINSRKYIKTELEFIV